MKTLPVWLRKELPQLLILALPFAVVAAYWDNFPPVVTSHWGIDGHPNGWMRKAPGLLLAPFINIALCVVLALLPKLDPKLRANASADTSRNRRLLRTLRLATTGFLSLIALMMAAVALDWSIDVSRVILNAVLVLLAVVGNVMGSLHPNYFFGIRTPWTLKDPETWHATHRLGGRLLVFGALAMWPLQFVFPAIGQFAFLPIFLAAWAVWSLVYSYRFYHRRQPAR